MMRTARTSLRRQDLQLLWPDGAAGNKHGVLRGHKPIPRRRPDLKGKVTIPDVLLEPLRRLVWPSMAGFPLCMVHGTGHCIRAPSSFGLRSRTASRPASTMILSFAFTAGPQNV
jgi:hypothetical protein